MSFDEVLDQVRELLRQRGRLSYGALKRRFDLDDAYVEDLKSELIKAERVAVDENGEVLVWTGTNAEDETGEDSGPRTPDARLNAAERRQLTVLFCDLVGSTALSAQLDPEDYQAVVQQYQQLCTAVIQRHEGYLAQYLGDGLLVYFGYPTAHEDDARRAVRTGLEIVEALQSRARQQAVKAPLPHGRGSDALQVRIGIHTGLVVIGEIGSEEKRELLALGETPNIAARIQGLAEPDTVIISTATQRLIDGQFESQPFGSHLVKGIDTPIAVYHVRSEQQSLSPLAGRTTLTPLVGRKQEVGLLIDRWEQAKEGRGQVVLLSGEPGIGKSRLAYTLREHVTAEGSLLFEARCSPYHQHSAFYPLTDVLQRTLSFTNQDTPDEKVQKLDRTLTLYGMQESLPLFAALLSLPIPSQYPSLNLTPQKQKERMLQALVQLLIAPAERQATVSVWEDLHWADPSSLEFLALLIDQIPTTRLLLVLTFRPEFSSPWKSRSHISQLVINRLGKKQAEAMIEKVTGGKTLPTEVIEQIRTKTDGVPLFVEELTKNVLESVESIESTGSPHHALRQLAIPATLQEALLARLDRLSSARQIAQLGATLGREFSYELLQAVTPLSETDLHTALEKLVESEILYQRGTGEQARYFFKHALIQDTAYQSLLKSTRQQYHQQIAQVLEEQSIETKEAQPELLAYHLTEAGSVEQAIPYWQRAGQRASQRSANAEAVCHLAKGLELLKTLSCTPERTQLELDLQTTLGPALMAAKGYAAPDVAQAYTRARKLCQQVGETPWLLQVLLGLGTYYVIRAELQTARELGEQCLPLAQRMHDLARLLQTHFALEVVSFQLGEFILAREHFEQSIALYKPQKRRSHRALHDPGVGCLSYAALVLWSLGYPAQALKRNHEALTLAQELSHPFSLAYTLAHAAWLHQYRREGQLTQERAEAEIALSSEQGFPFWAAFGTVLRGGALAEQGRGAEGIAQIRQGLAAYRATGAELQRTYFLALLAEAYGKIGQPEEGLTVLAEALATVDKTRERFYKAELYRLRGELTLQKLSVVSCQFSVPSPQPLVPSTQEAEASFLKAIDIARKQQAKSLELRASTSLARLWHQQGKTTEALKLLADVYNWFTEGFDTKDLQEAKVLLDNLESRV